MVNFTINVHFHPRLLFHQAWCEISFKMTTFHCSIFPFYLAFFLMNQPKILTMDPRGDGSPIMPVMGLGTSKEVVHSNPLECRCLCSHCVTIYIYTYKYNVTNIEPKTIKKTHIMDIDVKDMCI